MMGNSGGREAQRPQHAVAQAPQRVPPAKSGAEFEAEGQAVNPRTGQPDFTYRCHSEAEVRAAVSAAREAQAEWLALGVEGRIRVLQQWAGQLGPRTDDIVAALTTDTGRAAMSRIEMGALQGFIAGWSAKAPHILGHAAAGDYTKARTPGMDWISHRCQLVPYKVVGNISPWNYPIILSFLDTIPALVAGCAVVLKPSEVTPRWVGPLMETVEAVPALAKVLRVVIGPGHQAGAALVAAADAITFTGSTRTGRLVAESCAKRLIPCFLELGGNDPAVVLSSADVEHAATACLRAAVVSTGQSCMSCERVYVAREIYADFLAKMIEQAEKVTLNKDDVEEGQIGPFISAPQAGIVERQLADAVRKGATVHTGGKVERHGGGWWMNATVVSNVIHDMELMREETFGPVVPVMPFDTVDEAVRLANDTEYGLSAAVFAATVEEAEAVARRIDAGTICINDVSLQAYMMEAENEPFGVSGVGRSRMGADGLLRYFRKKALVSNDSGRTRSIFEAGETGRKVRAP